MDAEIGSIDFLQYWASAQLLAEGKNPYDAALIHQVELATSVPAQVLPVLLWNPPFIFPIIFWLKWIDFEQARVIWCALQIVLYACSILLVRSIITQGLERQAARRVSGTLVAGALLFYPFSLSLFYGQIASLLLFALSLSLYFMRSGREAQAGLLYAGTLCKPHLLFLMYIVSFLNAVRDESAARRLGGFMMGGALLAGAALVLSPHGFSWYLESLVSNPPIYWQTPTLGSWFQRITGEHSILFRLGPAIVAGAALIAHWFSVKGRPYSLDTILRVVIPLSLVSAPYGWIYDQLLLLPSFGWMIRLSSIQRQDGHSTWWAAPLLIGAAFAALLLPPAEWGQQGAVVVPLLFLAAGALLRPPHEYQGVS